MAKKQQGKGVKKKADHLYKNVYEMRDGMIALVVELDNNDGKIPPKSSASSTKKLSLSDLVGAKDNKTLDKKIKKDFDDDLISRPVFASLIWGYIRLKDLQDSKDKRSINLDSMLKEALGTNKRQITMFELTKFFDKAVKL